MSAIPLIVEKHRHALHDGFHRWPTLGRTPPALGDSRWPPELILATDRQLERIVAVEGNGRLTSFALFPERLPEVMTRLDALPHRPAAPATP